MKVFLQYSWDSESHKKWVLELANRLTLDGVDLYFDRYDLKVGSNNLHFMEQIESSTKVILIMSSGYKAKADARLGGIGYEYQIMSTEIAEKLLSTQKFIPVLRDGDATTSIPRLLRPLLYLDMRDDEHFEQQYLELLHLIFDEPLIKRPMLGQKPLLGEMLASAQELLKEDQLKTSKKVHDVIANSLYMLMAEIENGVGVDRERVLDRIENLYEKSRDISYNIPEFKVTEFNKIVSHLLLSFANENTKILIIGNIELIWVDVDDQKRYELEKIMQELMINMKKHSRATQVVWRFEHVDNNFKVSYSDNGIGMEKDQKINNGLENVRNRIDSIAGKIDFNTKKGDGLNIQISFPVR
ncbi:TIR domain-containing protein [Pedobacter nutrimenti]|uniref:TIR domain-containing protein n=1 Tax=Pedobacter nutrimenti TaxID=1241337 RepID=UPI00292CC49C|nr:TIR domain-containing protein [Pedobacter nutrimenti]